MVPKKNSSGKAYEVDFTGVTTSGSVPEDNYRVKIDDVSSSN